MLTLAVHPRAGEGLTVLRRHGPDAVWVEHVDGLVSILPTAWTSLHPRGAPLSHDGAPVRLAPDAALALAAWVSARGAAPAPPPVADETAAAQPERDGASDDDPSNRCDPPRPDGVVGRARSPRPAGGGASASRRSR